MRRPPPGVAINVFSIEPRLVSSASARVYTAHGSPAHARRLRDRTDTDQFLRLLPQKISKVACLPHPPVSMQTPKRQNHRRIRDFQTAYQVMLMTVQVQTTSSSSSRPIRPWAGTPTHCRSTMRTTLRLSQRNSSTQLQASIDATCVTTCARDVYM